MPAETLTPSNVVIFVPRVLANTKETIKNPNNKSVFSSIAFNKIPQIKQKAGYIKSLTFSEFHQRIQFLLKNSSCFCFDLEI